MVAESMVTGAKVARRHRIITSAYFSLAASYWDEADVSADHFAAFEAGLGRIPQASRALDLGTGVGGSAALVARRFPTAQVVATDLSRRMLRLARQRHREPNLEFRRARVERLPFADQCFDLVTLSNAVPSLKELARVTRPGGRVLMANTFFPRPDAEMWIPLWTKAGFHEVDTAELAGGHWEVWERSAA